MVDNLAVNRGGLIAKSYGDRMEDLTSIGVELEWSKFALDCFVKQYEKLVQKK